MSVHDERGWFQAAMAVARCGHAVVVLDPDAPDQVDELWDGDPTHGVVTVVSMPSLAAWQVHFSEELLTVEQVEDLLGVSRSDNEDDGDID